VTLDGSASVSPSGNPLTYSWTETAGPAVTLSSATAAKPTFVAPTVTSGTTTLTFSLVVSDGILQSTAATTSVSVAPAASGADLTSLGTIVAFITSPQGSGSKSLAVIRDGVFPAVGSGNSQQQYDTFTGATRTEDWIGYTFASPQSFGKVVFQDGMQFWDGGWFTSIKVQVRQGGVWVDVPGATISPAYKGHDSVSYETYTFTFPTITGDGIRIDGVPGGVNTFISVGELRVFQGQ
jgi:hypothetical protein